MKLELTEANDRQLDLVYSWIERQFDLREVKPLRLIRTLTEQGLYSTEMLMVDGQFTGYVLTAFADPRRGRLIDFLAVLPDRQDMGFGGHILRIVREQSCGAPVFLEVEDPDCMGTDADRAVALRRIAFYERNGCRMTGIRLNLYDVDFRIMTVSEGSRTDDAYIRARLEEVYHTFFTDEIYSAKVLFK
ncbi:MAG: hypothetical protein E7317_09735 [Clostridiales bacterium]|nr:hypothetical protein [Clostridiales bacterium]